MEIFNKGKRVINGIKPKTTAKLDKKLGEKLLKAYPGDLTVAGAATKVVSNDKEVAKLQKQVADLEAVVTAKDAELEKSAAQVADLEAKLADAEKALEAATAPAGDAK